MLEKFEKMVVLFPSVIEYTFEEDDMYDEDGYSAYNGFRINMKIDSDLYNGREEVLIRGFGMEMGKDLEV